MNNQFDIENTAAIVLAAGMGTRMKSGILKVFHKVGGRPMLDYVLEGLASFKIPKIFVVIGHQAEKVRENYADFPEVFFVEQKKLLGTGHAVMQVEPKLKKFSGDILILNGDVPLLRKETIGYLLGTHQESNASATVLTAELKDPYAYGRIIRGEHGTIKKIVEEKEADEEEKAIKEINTGTYCFNARALFAALHKVVPSRKSKEYYLTDTIDIMKRKRLSIVACRVDDSSEVVGINTRQALAKAEKLLRLRTAENLMAKGVTLTDPHSTFIDTTVKIGRDTVIHPFTFLRGKTKIGENCRIGPHSQVLDCIIEDEARIANSEIVNSSVGKKAQVCHSYICGSSVEPKRKIGPFEKIGG